MPPTFAASPKCTTCLKSVFFAEQQLGPGGKVYHKGCMRCLGCNKALDAFNLVDREGDPYCKSCYAKQFGPKGYGNGGALTGEYTEPPRINSPPKAAYRPLPDPPTPPPRREECRPPSPASTAGDSIEGATSWRTDSPVSNSGTGAGRAPPAGYGDGAYGSGSPKYGQPGKDLCRRCETVVYAAESVLAAGQKWHKRCLRCAKCSTSLSSHLTERDGLPYCRKCYTERYGVMAQGLMTRPGIY